MAGMFKPTYLYIKRHAVTGKCYFGKTTRNPVQYLGSGTVWRRHLNIHGIEHVETLWYKRFDDENECTCIALKFSEQQDIVKSDLWLNLIPENGLHGQVNGFKHSDEAKAKISEANKNRSPEVIEKVASAHRGLKHSKETKEKIGSKHRGKQVSLETRLKIAESTSKSKIGKAQSIVRCPYCTKEGGINTMKQWHFDRCPHKKEKL